MVPKVLILTASYGSGHVIAARALAESFRDKGVEPVIFDLVEEGGKTEKNAAVFYEFLMKRGHFIWKIFHDKIMPINKGNSIRGIYTKLYKKKFFSEIEKIGPSIIVSTMDTTSLIASLYAKDHPRVKIFTVITDFVAHPLWVWKNMDGYFVGAGQTKKYLTDHGIENSKVFVFGIPIRKQFLQEIDKEKAKTKLHIMQDKTVLLISAGTFSSVPVEKILKELSAFSNIYIVFLSGSNAKITEKLEELMSKYSIPGEVISYVENMEDYMSASDLYISKAGGLTVAECFVKKLPAIYLHNFPGHEEGNAKYAVSNGAAVIAEKNNLKQRIESLLKNPAELKELSRNAGKVALPNASENIIKTILSA